MRYNALLPILLLSGCGPHPAWYGVETRNPTVSTSTTVTKFATFDQCAGQLRKDAKARPRSFFSCAEACTEVSNFSVSGCKQIIDVRSQVSF